MIVPLLIGLMGFSLVAYRRGFQLKAIAKMALHGAWEARFVVIILLLIGCLTSLWRQTGTIAYFTYHGIRLIPQSVFILAAFLLSALMSYALGTSFGVAGTIGVILMTIVRASGVSTVIAGGAIMSGIYFGDRGSPAASSASLVAHETGTDVSKNFKLMLPSSLLPMAVCVVFYGLLSMFNRPESMDMSLLAGFEGEFNLSIWCLTPTVLLLVLAFAGMKIKYVMMINIVYSAVLTVFLQNVSAADVIGMTVLGYVPKDAALASILSGGGIASMLEVNCILLISSAFSGIFEGTKMLSSVEGAFAKLSRKIGRFGAMIVSAFAVCAVFCNQTIGIIMCRQCMGGNYGSSDEEKKEMMLDMENSVITIAGLVPWCIASSVPLSMLGCDVRSLPFAAYLFLLPLFWFLKRKREKKGVVADS
jgi:NhaC family Na+:H+ antiporter